MPRLRRELRIKSCRGASEQECSSHCSARTSSGVSISSPPVGDLHGYVYKTVARDAGNSVTTQWLQDNTSTYADDIHMTATAKTVSTLDRALLQFGTMLDALTDNDMIINATKSAFLLRHRAPFSNDGFVDIGGTPRTVRYYVFVTPKGTEYQIPLRDTHAYLGIKSPTTPWLDIPPHTDYRRPTMPGSASGEYCVLLDT